MRHNTSQDIVTTILEKQGHDKATTFFGAKCIKLKKKINMMNCIGKKNKDHQLDTKYSFHFFFFFFFFYSLPFHQYTFFLVLCHLFLSMKVSKSKIKLGNKTVN